MWMPHTWGWFPRPSSVVSAVCAHCSVAFFRFPTQIPSQGCIIGLAARVEHAFQPGTLRHTSRGTVFVDLAALASTPLDRAGNVARFIAAEAIFDSYDDVLRKEAEACLRERMEMTIFGNADTFTLKVLFCLRGPIPSDLIQQHPHLQDHNNDVYARLIVARRRNELRTQWNCSVLLNVKVRSDRRMPLFPDVLDGVYLSESEVHHCLECLAVDAKKKCGRCKNVYYCSEECQKKNWKMHKVYCARDARSGIIAHKANQSIV